MHGFLLAGQLFHDVSRGPHEAVPLADNAALHAENTLVVTGNAGDTLDLDLDQFTDTGVDTSVGGRAGYSVYENAATSAQVVVANEVTVV